MDPYHTLGVPKDCTRDELKEAFRARALLAHPDRGGEPATFIQLRHAYDQIIIELERRPPGLSAQTNERPARRAPRPKQPDPNWEPDLILLDEEPYRSRSPGSPDPNWEPDLILLDEEPRDARIPESPDPNWEPDLILLDDEPRQGRFAESRDPRITRQNYVGWLARLSARAQGEDSMSQETWFNVVGVALLFAVVIFSIWICWAVWSSEPRSEALDPPARQQGLRP